MTSPIYLGIRSRRVLHHAARYLEDNADALRECNSVDGVILDADLKEEHRYLVDTAKELRRIARERVNKETKR